MAEVRRIFRRRSTVSSAHKLCALSTLIGETGNKICIQLQLTLEVNAPAFEPWQGTAKGQGW